MATDMQSVLNGRLQHANHIINDMRERKMSPVPDSSRDRFERLLGTAQTRRTNSVQKPNIGRPNQDVVQRAASHPSSPSQTDRSERSNETSRQERSTLRKKQTHSQKTEDVEDDRNDDRPEVADTSNPSADLSSHVVLAAEMSSQSRTEGRVGTETAPPAADAAQAVEEAVNGAQSDHSLGSASQESQSAQTPMSPFSVPYPGDPSGQTSADGQASADAKSTAGSTKTPDPPVATNDAAGAELPVDVLQQNDPAATWTPVVDGSTIVSHRDPEQGDPALATSAAPMPKPAGEVHAAEHYDLQSPFGEALLAPDVSAGLGILSEKQFSNQDQSSSPESRGGSDDFTSNLRPSDDKMFRPQFLDQASGATPSVPSTGDSRMGRGEIGQSTVSQISETERIHELRSAFSPAQAVTLDLDPLDMGPLRVRIMMTEQTVHTHIRTEHGELGQGLLQQGPSLEASLRTTGLEMGSLRVTVDQQQERGENARAFHQQHNRAEPWAGRPAASAGEEARVSQIGQGFHHNGRVSWFA